MKLRWIALLIGAPAALVLVVVLALWLMVFAGGDSPGSIEDKAAKLADDQLTSLSPVPAISLSSTDWETCKQETPFEQRTAEYQRVVRIQVADTDAMQVVDNVEAWWQKAGYTVLGPDASGIRIEAKPPGDSDWKVSIGVFQDGHVYLTLDSDCLAISSNPKTGMRTY